MATTILSRLLHPHQTRRREEYISGSSLGSYLDISNRLSASVSDGSRPLSMKFHKGWRHADCRVMKWYQEQSRWSTKFTSIEHWRELRAPFHHEYLLIHLDDGAICRLERMGEGARADAIRPTGCTAHDIIQRFTKGVYAEDKVSRVNSELVIRIEFPHAFDLLDVLAICYGMQQVRGSSVYTLQRYNCYFLCLTVLNVLIRRVANWGASIDKGSWSKAVKNTIKELRTMKCDDAFSYLSLGICSLVDPFGSNPRKFILDPLGEELSISGLSRMNTAIAHTLWHKDFGHTAHRGLSIRVRVAISEALEGTSTGARTMKQLLDDNSDLEFMDLDNPTKSQQKFRSAILTGIGRSWKTSAKSAAVTYSMREVEDPTPLRYRLSFHLIALKTCIGLLLGRDVSTDFPVLKNLENLSFVTRGPLALHLLPVFLWLARSNFRQASDLDDDGEIDEFAQSSMDHALATAMRETIQSLLRERQDKPLAALETPFFNERWWRECLKVCVARHLEQVICQKCLSKGHISVYTSINPNASQMSVAEFQEYTIKRIQEHARRVASYGLAAAPFVRSEIESTMAKVWKKMPDGYHDVGPDPRFSEQGDSTGQLGWAELVEDYNLNNLFSGFE